MTEKEKFLGSKTVLSAPPSDLLASSAFGHELAAVPILFEPMNRADIAHTIALLECGAITRADGAAILAGLLALRESGQSAIKWSGEVGDIYNNRVSYLNQTVGPAIGAIHAGRARREASTIGWQIACRERLHTVAEAVTELAGQIVTRSADSLEALMPDFTYLQHAHPTTLGHYLLGFAAPLVRDLERLEDAHMQINRSPGGAGSVNGTKIPIDRERISALLGFQGLLEHTRDAMWAPDVAIQVAASVLPILTTIDRLSEELQIWSTSEFGFVTLSDSHCRTSVVMPQKRNPYALTYLRGVCRRGLGTFVGLAAAQMTPTGQPDNRTGAYVDLPTLLDETVVAVQLMSEVIRDCSFAHERMRSTLDEGHTYATDLCDFFTLEHGMRNREAHRVVGRAIRSAREADREAVTMSDLEAGAKILEMTMPPITPADLAEIQNVKSILHRRSTRGGVGLEAMHAMISDLRQGLQIAREHWSATKRQAAKALDALYHQALTISTEAEPA